MDALESPPLPPQKAGFSLKEPFCALSHYVGAALSVPALGPVCHSLAPAG